MKKPTFGMTQDELIEFLKVVIAGVDKMSRRQRWELRRNLKDYSRLVNVRWPYGKPADEPKVEPVQAEAEQKAS